MNFKCFTLTLGLGAAIGAVAVMMMPKTNPTRKWAERAAQKVEDTAWRISDRLNEEWHF